MTKTLKLEISVDNIGDNGAIVSTFATTDFVQAELNKKVNLTPEGKVDHTQLPDYTYITGLPEALEDERILREEAESTTLAQAMTYSDQKLSETAAKKADLVEGKIPYSQLPYSLNLETNLANEFVAVRAEIKQTSDDLILQIATVDTDLRTYVNALDAERKDYVDRALFTFLADADLRYNELSTRLQTDVDAKLASAQVQIDQAVTDVDNKLASAQVQIDQAVTDVDNKLIYVQDQLDTKLSTTQTQIDQSITDSQQEVDLVLADAKQGMEFKFDAALATSIGGYKLNAKILKNDGDLVKSTVDGNMNDPNTNMTGWEIATPISRIEKGAANGIPTLDANGKILKEQLPINSGGQFIGNAEVKAIAFNAKVINEDITIPGTVNALSAGPIEIGTGFTVNIETGATWVIV